MRHLIIIGISLTFYATFRVSADTSQEDPVVTNLRTYLRMNTAHTTPEDGYLEAIAWLKQQSEDIGLDFNIMGLGEHGVPDSFAIWLSWNGSDPSLQSILLNSHVDVVAADGAQWSYEPFEAYKDPQGNIFGRGASDMKSATVAELEALRRLKASGFQPLRTIHMSIVPDEEMRGKRGIVPFLETTQFKNLNVGVDIDEGFPVDSENVLHVSYGQKSAWHFNITAFGESAHGSTMPQYTAGHRLQLVIDELMGFRESELKKLQNGASIEDITSLNLVRLGGGIGDNIIPNQLWASFDMRIRLQPGWNYTDVETMILDIISRAQLGSAPNQVRIEYLVQNVAAGVDTPIDDSSIWWTTLQQSCQQLSITCEPHVFTAGTDGRFLRNLGIPVFGYNPFPNTPNTAHENDEFINELSFLRGINRYVNLIQNLASIPANVQL